MNCHNLTSKIHVSIFKMSSTVGIAVKEVLGAEQEVELQENGFVCITTPTPISKVGSGEERENVRTLTKQKNAERLPRNADHFSSDDDYSTGSDELHSEEECQSTSDRRPAKKRAKRVESKVRFVFYLLSSASMHE